MLHNRISPNLQLDMPDYIQSVRNAATIIKKVYYYYYLQSRQISANTDVGPIHWCIPNETFKSQHRYSKAVAISRLRHLVDEVGGKANFRSSR